MGDTLCIGAFFTKLLLEDDTARLLCRMGSALLSRFDVVFILLDIPDESHDRQLSEHVMANRTGVGRSSAVVSRTSIDLETSVLLEHSDMTLSDRLQVRKKKSNKKRNNHTFIQIIRIFLIKLILINLTCLSSHQGECR